MPPVPTPSMTTLAGACYATRRSQTTILRWLRASSAASAQDREQRPDLFTAEEAAQLQIPTGLGRRWAIQLAALERVHRARGGTYWHPEAAAMQASIPPAVAGYIQRLEAEVAALRTSVAARFSAETSWRQQGRSAEDHLPDVAGEPALPALPAPMRVVPARSPRATRPLAFDFLPPLPSTHISCLAFAKKHGREANGRLLWQRRMEKGLLPVDQTKYRSKNAVVEYSLDAEGRRVFGKLFGLTDWYRLCGEDECPACQEALAARQQIEAMAALRPRPF